MATIRDPNPIKLGEFHTVELYRNHTVGYIVLDGGEPINGSSQVLRWPKPSGSRVRLSVSYVQQNLPFSPLSFSI